MFKAKAAGLYFGSQGLSIVEFSQGKIKNYLYSLYPQNIPSPMGTLASRDSIFKVFLDSEVEIVAFLQKAIRDSRIDIEKDKVIIAIPTTDLIVRFFEIPPIPRKDIPATVGYEIKKYIPFKTEDISYDYQTRTEEKVVEVLFAGIKNEDLEKYNSLLAQLKVNVVAVEPSQFCLLRVLKARKIITNKDSVVILELGKYDGSIAIVNNGLSCFLRDIKLASATESQAADASAAHFRIINEVRVSIDYFRRQFLKKAIEKVLVISKGEVGELLTTFNKELSLPIVHKNPDEIIGIQDEYSLDLLKALGASFRVIKPGSLTINLTKKEKPVAIASSQQLFTELAGEIAEIPRIVLVRCLGFVIIVLVGVFAFGQFKEKPLQQELVAKAQEAQEALADELKGMDVSALDALKKKLNEKNVVLGRNFTRDFFFGEKLKILPQLLPQGIWLESISFDKDRRLLNFKGIVYKENETEARAAPYGFIATLKKNALFSDKITTMEVKGLRSEQKDGYKVMAFEVIISLSW